MNMRGSKTWSAVGFVCLVGCNGEAPDGAEASSHPKGTAHFGGAPSHGSATRASSAANSGSSGSEVLGAMGGASANATGAADGIGSSSSGVGGTPSSSNGEEGSIDTYDPPRATGGVGSTGESSLGSGGTSVTSSGVGGSGETFDPPRGGSSSSVGVGVGGSDVGGSGAGGSGVGGSSETLDPPPVGAGGVGGSSTSNAEGGTSSTPESPASGGVVSSSGSNPVGGSSATGGTGSVSHPDTPSTGGTGVSTGAGGTSSVGSSAAGGAIGVGGSDEPGGAAATGGSGTEGGSSAAGGSASSGGALGVGGTNAGGASAGGTSSTGGSSPKCRMPEIEQINVTVLQDAAPSGADVEGRMWVGHDATFTSSGFSVNSTNDAADRLTCADYGFVAGGDLRGTLILGSGKAAYAGAWSGLFHSNANPRCSMVRDTPVDFAKLRTTLTNYSATLRDYPANGTSTLSYGSLKLSGKSSTLNVFDVTATQLAAARELRFEAPAGSSIVVNVSGSAVTWQNAGFRMPDGGSSCRGLSSDWCHRILYNLHDAKTLTLQSIGIQGSVLAPYATLDGKNGNIDGQVVCDNLYGGLEYHPYFFEGCLELPL